MADTCCLFHFDGNFIDETGNTTVTNGNTSFYYDNKKFGTASLLVGGSYAYINPINASAFACTNNQLTLDFWIYRNSGANQSTIGFEWSNGSIISFQNYFGYAIVYTPTRHNLSFLPNGNDWDHIAIIYNNGNFKVYQDGILRNQWNETVNYNSNLSSGKFGRAGGSSFLGNLDEVRLSKTAVWTSDFDVPTQPYSLGPNYRISGNTSEAGKLILLSADDYSMLGTEDINAGNFSKGVDYGKKVVLLRNSLGKIDGVSEVMPTTI